MGSANPRIPQRRHVSHGSPEPARMSGGPPDPIATARVRTHTLCWNPDFAMPAERRRRRGSRSGKGGGDVPSERQDAGLRHDRRRTGIDPGTRPLRAGVRGHSHLCDRRYDVRSRGYTMVGGGFAQFISIPAGRLLRYSGHASPEEAALTEPLACCIHSTKRGRIQSEDAVAILGAGTMGALHLLLSKMRGAKVLVLDRDRARLRLARRLGAGCTIDVSSEDAASAVKRGTGGRGADAVFVAASSGSAGEMALGLAGKAGRVILFASTHPPESLQLPWNLLHDREVALDRSGPRGFGRQHRGGFPRRRCPDLKRFRRPQAPRVEGHPLVRTRGGTAPHAGRHGAARRSPASGPVRMTG